jgi:hypothetical protein
MPSCGLCRVAGRGGLLVLVRRPTASPSARHNRVAGGCSPCPGLSDPERRQRWSKFVAARRSLALWLRAAGFEAELRQRGYSPSAVSLRLWQYNHLSGWLAERGVEPEALTTDRAEQFLAAPRARAYRTWVSPRSMALPSEHLRRASRTRRASRAAAAIRAGRACGVTCFLHGSSSTVSA